MEGKAGDAIDVYNRQERRCSNQHMKESLKTKTIHGMFWSFSDTVMTQSLSFLIQIILARILLPEDFGLIGVIAIFLAIANSIIDSGFSNALIRKKEVSQKEYSTTFIFNLAIAALLYILLFLSAPAIAGFFQADQLIPILRVISVILIIDSFGMTQRIMMIRRIDFKAQAKMSCIASSLSGVSAIILAYWGYGVWALVFRIIVMQSMQTVLLCYYNRWKPAFLFHTGSFRELFQFGWKLLLSRMLDAFYQNLYYMIIGKYFSVTALGYYTNAKKLNDVASQALSAAVQKVSYPVLSAMQDDRQKLRSGYRRIIRSTMFIAFPLMIGLSAVSEPFILFMFGEKWAASVPYVQLMCVEGMLYPLHSINLNILQVKGRSDLFLRLELIKKMIFTLIVAAVMYVQGGIVGLILGGAASSVISYFINAYYSAALISYSIKEQLKDISPSFFISCMMGGIAWGAGIVVDSLPLKLLLQSFLCIGSYIFFSWLFRMEEIACIRGMVWALRK